MTFNLTKRFFPDDELERKILFENVDLFYRQAIPSSLLTALASFALLYAIYLINGGELRSEYSIWLSIQLFILSVRGLIKLIYFRSRKINRKDPIWYYLEMISLPISAAMWGIGLMPMVMGASFTEELIIFFFQLGLAGAASSSFSAIKSVLKVTVSVIVLPHIIYIFLFGEPAFLPIAFGALLLWVGTLRGAEVLASNHREKLISSYGLQRARDESSNALKDQKQIVEARGQFISALSHEIRTPLNAVLGMTEMLKQQKLSDQAGKMVATLDQAGSFLLDLVNNVLDFHKIDERQIEIEEKVYSIHEMLDALNGIFKPMADTKKLGFQINVSSDVENYQWGDRKRLSQILINLISNAIKYTDKGKVSVDISVDGGSSYWLSFTVTDTGIGLSETDVTEIFKPFKRAEENITDNHSSVGLGLAIALLLARQMGGSLKVKSTLGKGSSFILSLPYQPADKAEFDSTKAELNTDFFSNLKHLKILVIEDNLLNQKVIHAFLDFDSIEMDFEADGLVALEKIRTEKYDVILMDFNLPSLNGIDMTLEIRNQDLPNRKTPIIMQSADNRLETQNRAFKAGINEFIGKPYTSIELIEALCKAIGQQPIDIQENITEDFERETKKALSQMRSEFIVSSTLTMAELETQLLSKDIQAAKKTLHALKGTFGLFQEDELYDLCQLMVKETAEGCDLEKLMQMHYEITDELKKRNQH